MVDLIFAGYHGTSLSGAKSIEQNGFQEGSDVFFAPLDNLWLAQDMAKYRAEESGEEKYGLVQATFPAQQLEFGLKGDHAKVPASLVGQIVVRRILVFNLSGLLESNEPAVVSPEFDVQ